VPVTGRRSDFGSTSSPAPDDHPNHYDHDDEREQRLSQPEEHRSDDGGRKHGPQAWRIECAPTTPERHFAANRFDGGTVTPLGLVDWFVDSKLLDRVDEEGLAPATTRGLILILVVVGTIAAAVVLATLT
jgi:hypothetical protein